MELTLVVVDQIERCEESGWGDDEREGAQLSIRWRAGQGV